MRGEWVFEGVPDGGMACWGVGDTCRRVIVFLSHLQGGGKLFSSFQHDEIFVPEASNFCEHKKIPL